LSYLELTSPVIYLVIFHLFSLLAMDYTRQIAQVTTQFNKISILQVVEKVLILVVVLLWGEDIFSVLGLIIAAAFGCRTWFFFSLGKNFYWPFRINISLCKQLLRFSFPLLLVSLGGFIFGWVDIAVIKHLCHFRDVGIYSLAYSGLGAIESVVLLMPTILTPIFVSFASQKRDGMTDRFIQRVLPQISYLWGGVFMLAGLGSIWGIPVVFGQSFSKATNIFLVLLICLNLGVLNALGLSIFVSYDMVSKMSIINFAASIVNLVLDLILVPVIGIVGAAFATTVSYFVISASYYILVKKLFYFSVKNLLIFQGIVCIQLTGLLVFKDPVIYFVITLTAAGMYFVSSKYMGIFSEEDKTTYNRLEMPVFLKKTFIRICDYYG
jgi:O-antigen/teichoic acid export membrane protein